MRPRSGLLLVFALAATAVVGLVPPAGAGPAPCVEVKGRVRDLATGLPLAEVTSVELADAGGPIDGFGTDENSRYSVCVVPGVYYIKFVADDYRPEWYHDQPNFASATPIAVTGPDPIVVNEALVPRGRVIAGRVTNASGVPKFGSVGIWRQTSTGWHSIDGIGNDEATGWYSFVVPGPGRYRVSAGVDHHKARFATSATHLSAGRIITIGVATTFIDDVHVRVPYCPGPTDDICVPAGFLT
jgi:hypothetical protein